MSRYMRFTPQQIRSAAINALERCQLLGDDILINSSTILLNRKCSIDFEIHTNDFTTDNSYDENLSITQNNLKFIVSILQDYNDKRVHYIEMERKLLHDINNIELFSISDVKQCIEACKYTNSITDIILYVNKISVINSVKRI